jgi:Flp pilus assembly protein TadD/peroxiredoxin
LTVPGGSVIFALPRGNLRGIVLNRPKKISRTVDAEPRQGELIDGGRRDFLIRCFQGATAGLIPNAFRALVSLFPRAQDSSSALGACDFQLHPRYRTPRPLDALLVKTKAGLEDFASEKYADDMAAILATWSASLEQSPGSVEAIGRVLAPRFLGMRLEPSESRLARPGPPVEVRRNTFAHEASLAKDDFLKSLRRWLAGWSRILTAEFQITSIDAGSISSPIRQPPGHLRTLVRYELVGEGDQFYREQRVGYWDLVWETASGGEFVLRNWQALGETQSRSASCLYLDVTSRALGGNGSYSSQLLHGTDYWRSVLDGACGIDIYGHNGVSIGDIDGNGLDDLYLCQPGGLPNRLYRNRGDGTFEDITESAGVGVLDPTACALFVDVENDGRQDLIVVRASGPLLFVNEGGGKFRQRKDAFQFASPPQGTFTGAAVADYDRDGWLDIYFCLYLYYQGAEQYQYPSPYYDANNGPPNFLMRNQRDGSFRDVTSETGLDKNNTRYSFCCGWSDCNDDGWPDLFVVNDFGRKNLYRNNGNGTFTDISTESHVEDVGAGMSVCCFDYNNDGAQDFYVGNMWTAAGERIALQPIFKKEAPNEVRQLYYKHAMGNSLFRNGGVHSGSFQDATSSAGVGMGRWAWSSDAWDFDHDGFPDLYIANGMVSGPLREDLNSFFWRRVVANSPDEAKPSQAYEQGWSAINELIRADGTWSGYERNVFYANHGDGTFSDISGATGLDFIEDGRSFAIADFDQDGRQEVFLKNRNGPQLRILKNVMEELPPSIAFRLRGTKSNRDAIGAAVTLETEIGRQTRVLQAGSGFLSQHSKELFFGLGKAKGPVRASVRWPSGTAQEFDGLRLNHRVWIREGSEQIRIEPFRMEATRSRRDLIAQRKPQETEELPTRTETWLLAPVDAPEFSLPDLTGKLHTLSSLRGKPVLLNFWGKQSEQCWEELNNFNRLHARWAATGLELVTINVDQALDAEGLRALERDREFRFLILRGSEAVPAIYNILYRYLFDRHRDMGLPTSFLINEKGAIVKVYQGPVNLDQVDQDFRHIPQNTAERLGRALPFPGSTDTVRFGRNYLSYGSIFFQRGYLDQAEAVFRSALRDDPSSAEAWYGIGSVCLNQQRNAEARENFRRAVKLTSTYPDTLPNAWNNLGILSTREGRMDEAIEYFRKALELRPDHPIALDNLGGAYRQTKRWMEAQQTYERALRNNPADAEANYGLGMVYAQNEDTARAEDYLQHALKLRPAYPEALNNLGILYLRTQRRDQAVASFEESIRVAPDFDQSYLNLARVHAIEGNPGQARAVLVELLKHHSEHAQAKKMLEQLAQGNLRP